MPGYLDYVSLMRMRDWRLFAMMILGKCSFPLPLSARLDDADVTVRDATLLSLQTRCSGHEIVCISSQYRLLLYFARAKALVSVSLRVADLLPTCRQPWVSNGFLASLAPSVPSASDGDLRTC